MNEIITVALRRSPGLELARIEVQTTSARLAAARGETDTTLELRARAAVTRNEPAPGEFFQTLAADSAGLFTRVVKPLRSGGSLSLRVDGEYRRNDTLLESNGSRQRSESKLFAPAVGLELSQPLVRGRGAAVARAAERQAEIADDAASRQRAADAARVVRDVVRAYWEAWFAARTVDIRRGSLGLAREQLRVVRVAIAAGDRPVTAAAEVEVAIANREEDLLLAEGSLYERSLELRRLAGLEIAPGELALDAADSPPESGPTPDLDDTLRQALAQNPELVALRARGRSAGVDLEVADDALRPRLDLTVNVRATGSAAAIEESLQQLASYRGLSAEGGLVFSTPIGGGREHGARDAAAAQVRRTRVLEAEMAARIALDSTRAVNAARVAAKRVEVQTKSADLSRLNLDVELLRYRAGGVTSFEVLRRQAELAEAQLRQARATVDRVLSEADIEALTGEILGRHGVTLRAPGLQRP